MRDYHVEPNMFEIKVPCSAIVVTFSANISASEVVTFVGASDVKTSKIIEDEMEINSMISAKRMQRLQSEMEKNALNQGQASGLKASIIKCPVVENRCLARHL